MQIFEREIILASKSPRRSQLLKEAGFKFKIRTREVDESYPTELPASEVAEFIAKKKALACQDFLESENNVLLTADTIVVLDNVIYGKPKDYEDAIRILSELSGRTHRVITGVCLTNGEKTDTFHDTAEVTFAELNEEEIRYYLDNYQPFDKAGSYGMQEWLGHCKIKQIKGTYATIIGLPVNLVYQHLMNF